MFTKSFIFITFTILLVNAVPYELPDGLEYISNINPSFQCSSPGYFADIDSNCQLFNVCINQEFPDGKVELAQYTFACGNQTVFNQFSMTCASPEEAIPCASSADFFYLNERIGQETAKLHEDADVEKAAALIPGRQ